MHRKFIFSLPTGYSRFVRALNKKVRRNNRTVFIIINKIALLFGKILKKATLLYIIYSRYISSSNTKM